MNKNVIIFCKNDNQYYDVPMGASLLDISKQLGVRLSHRILAARVNYKVENLDFALYRPKDVEFIDASSPSGMRVYTRSLCMVMAMALNELQPKATLRIEHPIDHGYYCCIDDRSKPVDEAIVTQLRNKMHEIVKADLTIFTEEKQTPVVIDMFKQRGQNDKAILLETMGRPYSRYFRMNNYVDYYNGVLVPSSGYVPLFDLVPFEHGMLLRVPDHNAPDQLAPLDRQPKLFDTFNEFVRWNKLMGISNVGDFNLLCKNRSVYNLIKVAEAIHEKKIAQIADKIVQQKKRFVLISGPSSSGKTTFSKRLSVQLLTWGIKPIAISLDNYFVDREHTPKDANGEYDFEHIKALDLNLFNKQMTQLLNGEEVNLPVFKFDTGTRIFSKDKTHLDPKNILVVEGIHALNPELISTIPQNEIFKIYVSCLTTISLDNHNWIATTDTRLLRRIVRDYKYRKYSAADTIKRWPSVRRGEDKWIFPYQENADVMFNSALLFELAVIRRQAETILNEVPKYCDEYTEANRLLRFLQYFTPIDGREIPPTSLLREFLGGSSFQY